MARFTVAALLLELVLVGRPFAQSGAVTPQGGAGHATQSSCVILKRMGPADQVTSRLYSFGIRGKQFQYVEGKLPNGFPFHGRLTDHDVRNLQGRGTEVVVLNQDYTSDDLKQARIDCKGETGRTPLQDDAQSKPIPSPSASDNSVARKSTVEFAELDISSVPPNADIEIDGGFGGSTPSSIRVDAGEHAVRISKKGYAPWERKIRPTTGTMRIVAELEQGSTPAAASPRPTSTVLSPEAQPAVPAAMQPAAVASPPVKSPEPPVQPVAMTSATARVASPDPERGATQAGAVSPATVAATEGIVSVTSEPDGADVFVDSVGRGSAPALLKLKPGKHKIQLVRRGYKDWVREIEVKADSVSNVSGKLEK